MMAEMNRAVAPGVEQVTGCDCFQYRKFFGIRTALVAAGILRDGEFPGDCGTRKGETRRWTIDAGTPEERGVAVRRGTPGRFTLEIDCTEAEFKQREAESDHARNEWLQRRRDRDNAKLLRRVQKDTAFQRFLTQVTTPLPL